ncbi:HlyD family secretion protein [Flavobacterium sp. '19STA2R22 D10 B1']|uniref:HlyD family secretion protein n=1 Tax=Flavobacterium aerium TaxID=3037261 RepID=UPI00278BE3F8|nr:efflux RND transporter periplasmic adaptor subunit [Flavobacterium sp. '19STA2R22 D10 B1']
MKNNILFLFVLLTMIGCKTPNDTIIQGKTERDMISVVSKVPGRIHQIKVKEGSFVKKGDTLAILDIPEVDAKVLQAKGAVTSAKAQYNMAVKGATNEQLIQLQAKHDALREQFLFAEKSVNRLRNMLKDSLISQQTYDETFAKYQGAKSQYTAVQAELSEAKRGARPEQQTMALGQQNRALGALQEAETADKERYIIAPQDMTIENITLKIGELALPGYTLFNGYLLDSTYFRFTFPESKLNKIKTDQKVTVKVLYKDVTIEGTVSSIKQLSAYANIATAYPDYEYQEALYEVKINPTDLKKVADVYTKTTVTLSL